MFQKTTQIYKKEKKKKQVKILFSLPVNIIPVYSLQFTLANVRPCIFCSQCASKHNANS